MKNKFKVENLIILIIGAWVFLLPMSVGMIPEMKIHTYIYSFTLVGSTTMVMSFLSMRRMFDWAETLNLFAGIWLIVSPFLLFFYDKSNIYFWNSIIPGALIALLSAHSLHEANKIHYHLHRPTEEDNQNFRRQENKEHLQH